MAFITLVIDLSSIRKISYACDGCRCKVDKIRRAKQFTCRFSHKVKHKNLENLECVYYKLFLLDSMYWCYGFMSTKK